MALVNRWTLDNTPNDSVGAYSCTNSGVTYSSGDRTIGNYCGVFNGSSYMYSDGLTPYAYTNFSIALWFKFPPRGAGGSVAVHWGQNNSNGDRITLNLNGDGNIYYQVVNTPANASLILLGINPVMDNMWHHYVAIDSNGSVEVFLDGVSKNTGSYTRVANNHEKFTIGCQRYNTSTVDYYFTGRLDDIRLYSHALSQAEITDLWLSRLPRWQTPISRWTLDNTANDLYGVYNGTGTNMTYSSVSKVSGSYSGTFNGSAYIAANSVKAILNTNFTWSLWTKHTTISDKALVAMSDADSDLAVIQTGASSSGKLRYTVNEYGSGLLALDSIDRMDDNSWHHVVVVDANGSVTLYIDGKYQNAGSYTRQASTDMDHTTFGAYWHYSLGYLSVYTGSLDDIRFYDIALTTAEVKALYASYFTEKAANFMSTLV